ncbi:MAG TPA: NADH-quinone oxidoreductase subunit C [Acidimicrobiia bacterium]|nr:NADH-quinone oxidoreductase subunit C [Acidimicrobiia bacterium]
MTTNQSETTEEVANGEETPEVDPLQPFADEVAEAVGGAAHVTFGTVKVAVARDRWKRSVQRARDDFGLVFFSWLSATHWSNEVAVGDPLGDPVEERYELLCTIADLSEGRRVTLSADLDLADPRVESLVSVFPGADWHEREAHDMFGIVFDGHPGLEPLYLPNGFAGHPLRKTYPLLSREVKPWPGKVDVEPMPDAGDDADDDDAGDGGPSTENPEA